MTNPFQITLADEAATRAFGALLGRTLPNRFVIALDGTLGAGKTRLTQGLAAAIGLDPETVLSPTYTLIHEYSFQRNGHKLTLYHLDAYRVHDAEEFWELGIEELYAADGWVVIEWAERVKVCLPDDYLHIALDATGPESRVATLTAYGANAALTLESIALGSNALK